MRSMNKIMLIGYVGKDAECLYSQNNAAIINFTLATTESIKKGDNWVNETEWHSIKAFGKLAENVGKMIKKGVAVYVEGKKKTRTYKDKNDVEKSVVEIIANEINILEKIMKTDEQGSEERQYTKETKKEEKSEKTETRQQEAKPQDDDDDDLPF